MGDLWGGGLHPSVCGATRSEQVSMSIHGDRTTGQKKKWYGEQFWEKLLVRVIHSFI